MYHIRLHSLFDDDASRLRDDNEVDNDAALSVAALRRRSSGREGPLPRTSNFEVRDHRDACWARLFRQMAFKSELLVPVVPTAFAAVLLPELPDDVDAVQATRHYFDVLFDEQPGAAAARDRFASFADLLLVRSRSSTPSPSSQSHGCVGASIVIVDASRMAEELPEVMGDVFDDTHNVIIDLLDRIAHHPHPFLPAVSSQHAVAVACDPRPECIVSTTDGGPSRSPGHGGWFELPTCLSCLDRIDRLVSGILPGQGPCRCSAGLCRCHQGSGRLCAVCSAIARLPCPDLVGVGGGVNTIGPLRCAACGAEEDPWACLVCGRIGCSRYRQEHAKGHWERSRHAFTLNLVSQHVWDYESDAFIHRLIVSFDDSGARSFELPDRTQSLQHAVVSAKLAHHLSANPASEDGAATASDSSPPSTQQQQNRPPREASGTPTHRYTPFRASPHPATDHHATDEASPKKNVKKKEKNAKHRPAWAGDDGDQDHDDDDDGYFGDGDTTVAQREVEMKQLIDAKLDSKAEELCASFSRQMAFQLEVQRRHLMAMYGGGGGGGDGEDAEQQAETSQLSASSSPVLTAADVQQLAAAEAEVAYGAFDADTAAEGWRAATLAVHRLEQRIAIDTAAAEAAEAEESELSARQDSLKARVACALGERHAAEQERKRRVKELHEMIAEAQLNLDARRRVGRLGLTATDTAASFTATTATAAPNRRGRGRRAR